MGRRLRQLIGRKARGWSRFPFLFTLLNHFLSEHLGSTGDGIARVGPVWDFFRAQSKLSAMGETFSLFLCWVIVHFLLAYLDDGYERWPTG